MAVTTRTRGHPRRPTVTVAAHLSAMARIVQEPAFRGVSRLATESADTVRLSYSENTGGFLGLGAELPPATRTVLVLGVRQGYAGWPSHRGRV